MLTLVVCLTLVVLSGAAVLRITLDDDFQRATPASRRRRVPADPEPGPPPPAAERAPEAPGPAGAADRPDGDAGGAEVPPPPATGRSEPSSTAGAVAPPRRTLHGSGTARRHRARRHRLRSGTVLVVLLVAVGGLLALVVAVTMALLVVALRGAVG